MNYPQRTREYLRNLSVAEADKAIAYGMLEHFEQLPNPNALQRSNLEIFMQGARHDQALNRKIACEILVAVGQHAEVARECLSELCRDKKMEVRHWTLAYLSMDLPRDFVLDRLRDALSDRSATVRISASETITDQKIYELQNNLEAAAQVEKNDKAKRALSMNLGLLKDGYYVLYREGMRPNLNVMCPGGGVVSKFIKQEDVEAGRVPMMAEKLLDDSRHFHQD